MYIFRKRATNNRALLRKMTYIDKASYDSRRCPSFDMYISMYAFVNAYIYAHVYACVWGPYSMCAHVYTYIHVYVHA